jgi:restriction endonuclease S subunit
MQWIAPSKKGTDNAALEKRLWDAADQFRANSGLKSQEYSAPVLGLIPRVILKDLKRFELLLPSKEVQTAWAKIAEPMTEQIWRLIDKIQNLRRTRDLLLPRLLSGQVNLKGG